MTTNFEIDSTTELLYNEVIIDLHNNFDLTSFQCLIDENMFIAIFAKSNGEWVKQDEFESLQIIHYGVSYLKISGQNQETDLIENKCLGDVTFFPSAEREVNDRLIMQKRPMFGDDIIYTFESGRFIRIGCQSIELITKL